MLMNKLTIIDMMVEKKIYQNNNAAKLKFSHSWFTLFLSAK